MADYDDPRPSSQPTGSTEGAVGKDNLITLDRIMTAPTGTEITNRKGKSITPIVDIIDGAENVVQAAVDAVASDTIQNTADIAELKAKNSVTVSDSAIELTQTSAELQTILDDSASVLKAVAISAGTTVENVMLATNTTDAIVGYIYDAGGQVTYSAPSYAQGKFIDSVVGRVLTTTDASVYTLTSVSTQNEIVNVADFGAVAGADSSDEFQLAVDSLPDTGGVISLGFDGSNWVVSTVPNYGTKVVKFIGAATVNGAQNWNLGATQESFSIALNRNMLRETAESSDHNYTVNWEREAAYSGGATGNPNTLHRLYTKVNDTVGGDPNGGAGDGRKAEWTQQARIDNYSDWANAVAVTGQARAYAQGAVWSGQFNTIDYVVPMTYARRAIEANIQADGADVHELRFITESVAHSVSQVYTGDDNIYAGFKSTAHTADLKHAYVAKDTDGKGAILESAYHAEFSGNAKFLSATNRDNSVIDERVTLNDSGFISEFVTYANNSSGEKTEFSRFRTSVSSNASGTEKGEATWQVSKAGSMSTVLAISGDNDAVRLMVGGSLKRVSEGDADSGGAGYKLLRVPN